MIVMMVMIQTLSHTHTRAHKNPHKPLLHKHCYTRILYTKPFAHTHTRFCSTRQLLQTDGFTQRCFYTEYFTRRTSDIYAVPSNQKLLNTQKLYALKLLLADGLHGQFYTQALRTENKHIYKIFAQRYSYIAALLPAEALTTEKL